MKKGPYGLIVIIDYLLVISHDGFFRLAITDYREIYLYIRILGKPGHKLSVAGKFNISTKLALSLVFESEGIIVIPVAGNGPIFIMLNHPEPLRSKAGVVLCTLGKSQKIIIKGNHKGLPLPSSMVCRGNPLLQPLMGILFFASYLSRSL